MYKANTRIASCGYYYAIEWITTVKSFVVEVPGKSSERVFDFEHEKESQSVIFVPLSRQGRNYSVFMVRSSSHVS